MNFYSILYFQISYYIIIFFQNGHSKNNEKITLDSNELKIINSKLNEL